LVPLELENALNLSATQRLENSFEEALLILKKIKEKYPEHAEVYSEQSRVYLENNNLDRALQNIYHALRLEPRQSSNWTILGSIHKSNKDYSQAIDAFEQALQLHPPIVEPFVLYSQTLQEMGHLVDAEQICLLGLVHFTDEISLHHQHISVQIELGNKDMTELNLTHLLQKFDDPFLWLQLGHLQLERGAELEAIDAFECCLKLCPSNSEARHFRAAAIGHHKAKPEREYMQGMFDSYAKHFEDHLLNTLEYQVPQLMTHAVRQFGKATKKGADLGCGTGLLGHIMRPHVIQLDGVDLSKNMLIQAKERCVYDNLINQDIGSFLKSTKNYGMIMAGDVFNYLGALEDVFTGLYQSMEQGGLLFFTLEVLNSSTKAVVLTHDGRYQHNCSHVINYTAQNGFQLIDKQIVQLRKECGQWVEGALIVLKKAKGEK
jgi:predicted TPR repeat methyltransferase